jgi:hypothetical protein
MISTEAKEALKNKVLDKKWSFEEGIMSYRAQIKEGLIVGKFIQNGKFQAKYKDGSYRQVSKIVYDYIA